MPDPSGPVPDRTPAGDSTGDDRQCVLYPIFESHDHRTFEIARDIADGADATLLVLDLSSDDEEIADESRRVGSELLSNRLDDSHDLSIKTRFERTDDPASTVITVARNHDTGLLVFDEHAPESLVAPIAGDVTDRISDRVAQILQDYIDGPRVENTDDHGRAPLFSTREGRISRSAVRYTFYRWTRPCVIGLGCPHGEDTETCEYLDHNRMSGCPSSRSPHDVRKARVTRYRNDNVPRAIVSDRLNASEDVLDLHYDRASDLEKAERRWEFLE